jgi:hypothetical protein
LVCQLELISYNDDYEPEVAIAKTNKLIEEDKVFALIGEARIACEATGSIGPHAPHARNRWNRRRLSDVSIKIMQRKWKGMANPNPTNKFQKGHARLPGAGRKPGQANYVTRDIRQLIREAAAETGFIEKVPVLDAAGKPTGQYEYRFGEEGEKGYLKWLATNQPAQFASLYGRLVPREPLDVNQKTEEKTVVRYETVEERRAAMIAKGWSPTVLAALEEAMEPKFLRDMREKSMREEGMREEDEGQGEAEH